MTTTAKAPESNFTPAPEGLYPAVCCDVWDSWTQTSTYTGAPVEKTRIVWEIDAVNEDTGRPFEVSTVYTLSLHEKSTLYKHLTAWRGRPFTKEELRGFDLENLIGVGCQVQIVHVLKDNGKRYANVQAVVPLGRGMTKLSVSPGYVRHKDRAPRPGSTTTTATATAPPERPEITDDDVPF